MAEDTRMVGTSHKGTIMSDGQFDRAKSKRKLLINYNNISFR